MEREVGGERASKQARVSTTELVGLLPPFPLLHAFFLFNNISIQVALLL